MVVLQKLLRELRTSTARLSHQHVPMGAFRATLRALLDYIGPLTAPQGGVGGRGVTVRVQVPPSSYICIETMLSIGQHHNMLDPTNLADPSSLLSMLVHSQWSADALSNYGFYFNTVLEFNAPYVQSKSAPPLTNSKARSPEALQESWERGELLLRRVLNELATHTRIDADTARCVQSIILGLLGLAMQQAKFLEAFKQIVPTAIHMLLKEGMYFRIHDKFKSTIEQDEDLMTKPFFWTEHVLKLFGPDAVERIYPTLNSESTVYYDVVKLCLRLLEAKGKLADGSGGKEVAVWERINSFRMSQRSLVRSDSDTMTRPRGHTATFIAQNASM
ncbi:MAG: hypothetical protein SGPRY_014439, partial [Prymnesium sp.]